MSKHAIDTELINPFVVATGNVFRTMLGCEVTRESLFLKESAVPPYEVSGVIGLTGRKTGTMLISLSREVAIGATEALLGYRPTSLNEDVVDAVGEIANMIAGNAKANLEDATMSLSLPNVIMGKNHVIAFPSGAVTLGIPFETSLGDICIEIGFTNS